MTVYLIKNINMVFKYIYSLESIAKEILRVLIFLLVITFYLTSTIGMIAGGFHLILAISNSKKYGMSRILIKILPGNKF